MAEPSDDPGPDTATVLDTGNDAILFETDDGISEVLTPEQLALRQRAGTGPEGAEVTAAELAEVNRAAVTEEVFGGIGQQAITGLEGFASGLTFGLTDLIQTEEGAYNAALRAQANPFTRGASTVLGAVAPSILTGGSGAAASLARLTPAGRMAALTGSIAARGGSSLGGRVAAGAASGFVDGAAAGVGNYLAQLTLDEDAEFSAEALLSAAGKGGLMGGVLGGALPAAGRLTDSVTSRIAARADDAVLGRLATKANTKADELIRDADGALRTARRKYTSYKAVAPRGFGEDAQRALGQLARSVDDKALASVDAVLDDALTVAVGRGLDDATLAGLKAEAQAVRKGYRSASSEAKQWVTEYAATSKNAAQDVADMLTDRGAITMARLDEAKGQLDDVLGRLRGDVAPVSAAVAAQAPGRGRRVVDALQNLAGVAETAQALGAPLPLPSVRSIPIIGDAMSAYLQLKAGLRVARKTGLVPSTGPVRAAAKVNETRELIGAKVLAAARGAYAKVAPAVRIAPVTIATQVAELGQVRPGDHALGTTQDAGIAVSAAAAGRAGRQVEYLRAVAPRNPMAGTPWGADWEPTPSQADDWSRRVAAVTDPEGTISALLTGSPANTLEAEALKASWPALYEQTRQEIMIQAPELVRQDPVRAAAIGRAFDVPLSITQLPGYSRPTMATPELPPLDFGGPSAATTSPIVTGDLTGEQARAAGRR